MSDKNEENPDMRVRRLKKDGSWIRKQDDSTTSKPVDLETKPLVKRNSFVLMAVKRYESLDSSSTSPQETDSGPFNRDSTNQKGGKNGSSIQTPSNKKPKEDIKHLVTSSNENAKTGNVKTSPSVDSAPLPESVSRAEIIPKEVATSEVQPVNDTAAEKIIKSTHEKAPDFELEQKKEIAKPVPSADNDNQTALSEQDAKGTIKDTADVKAKSLPDVPAVNVAKVSNETFLPNTKQPVTGGLSEAESEKKPGVLPESVSALKAKSEAQLADDAGVKPSVLSTPEQVSEYLPKKLVNLESPPNIDYHTSSEQHANKAAAEVKVETSPKVPSANKATLTNEGTPAKREPLPNGLSEAPAVKADVKLAKSQQDPAPLPEPFTLIRAEKVDVNMLEDDTAPPNSEQPLSHDLSKTPADKAAITPAESEEKPVASPEPVSELKAKSDIQSADDSPVGQSFESTPEQASEETPKKVVHLEPFPNTGTPTSSVQDANKIGRDAAQVEVDSTSEVPSTKVTVEATQLKSIQPLPNDLSEAPFVKAAESQDDPSLLPEPFTVITAEKVDVSPVEDETTPLNEVNPVCNKSSQSAALKALPKLAENKEDSAAAQESVSVITPESEVQSGVVEQIIEPVAQNNVEPLPSVDTKNQTSPSKEATNKLAKTADIEVESSPKVPSTNKETITNETSLPKSLLSDPSGLFEVPAVKADVKTAESPENPAPLLEPSTVIRAEREAVYPPVDKTTPPNSEQPLSQGHSKSPADKSIITSGESEEKPVALTVSALIAKSKVQLADDTPVKPSVVSTPEQVSIYQPKELVKVDPSPNIATQTASEQDAKAGASVEIESLLKVPSADKATLTDEATLSKRELVPSGLPEAAAVIADVKPGESQKDPVKTPQSKADLNINNVSKPEASTDTNPSPLKQQLEKVTAETVEEVELKSIPEMLAPTKATTETTTYNSEILVSERWPKSPPAETVVKAAERGEDSAARPEAVPAICAESDVQSLDDDAAVKQSDEATSEHAAKQMPALKTDEDVQTVPVADNEDLVPTVSELTDALEVEAPAPESVLISVDVPEPCLPQDSGLMHSHAENKNFEDLGKIAEDPSSTQNPYRLYNNNDICTYCSKIIDGKAKIVFTEPSVICHPECLKCELCGKHLGSLQIPLYFCDGAIVCADCYRKA